MATSGGSFPRRATAIDELTRDDHYYLDANDQCAFIGEYTAGAGYRHSQTNQLIHNLKKGTEKRGTAEWYYKERAIEQAAAAFRAVLSDRALSGYTYVPIPPSKARGDPGYDDRMTQVLLAILPSQPIDARELIVQTESTAAAHESPARRDPCEIQARYRVDEELTSPAPAALIVVDDVLTTGAHFKAAQSVLIRRFAGVPMFGLFVARRALPEDDVAEVFE